MRTIVSLVLLTTTLGAQAGEADEVFAWVRGAVVSVDTLDEQARPDGQGSGVLVARDTVVTNCHVVEEAHRIRVTWQGKTLAASLKRMDAEHDLCLLEAPGIAARPVVLRKREDLRVGDAAYAVGNPLGFELTVSMGLISALPGPGHSPLIHTSAPVSPGSSGGGLFDAQGRLMGITAGLFRAAQNFNTVLPADWVETLLASQAPLPAEPALPAPDPDWEREIQRLQEARDWPGYRALAQRYLEAFPTSAKARFHLGFVAERLGEPAVALKHYQDAVDRDPHMAEAWRNQASALVALARPGEAGQAIRKALDLSHEQSDLAWAMAGELAFRDGHPDKAQEAFQHAVRLFPGEPAYWTWLGFIEARQGRDEAAAAYRKALRLNPDDTKNRDALAELRTRAGNSPGGPSLSATGVLGSASATETAQGAAPVNRQEDFQSLMTLAASEYRKSRLAEAERAWRKAAELDPKAADPWGALATMQVAIGLFPEAETSLLKAVALDPTSARLWSLLGQVQFQVDKPKEAEESLWRASQLSPEDAQVWMKLAAVRAGQGNIKGQNSALKRAVTLAPDNAQAWASLATARALLDREDAREAAERALKLAPDNPDALNALSIYHSKRGELAKSLALLDKLVAAHPGDADIWNNKGYTLLKMGRAREAVKAFETAIRLSPEFSKAWINLGEARLRQGQIALAIQALEKAIALSPRAMDARLYLAEAYMSSLQPGAAREHLGAVIQMHPRHAGAWKRLVEMHLALGDKAEARRALDRLAMLDGDAARKLGGHVKSMRDMGKR